MHVVLQIVKSLGVKGPCYSTVMVGCLVAYENILEVRKTFPKSTHRYLGVSGSGPLGLHTVRVVEG